jgi:hypothetical protein
VDFLFQEGQFYAAITIKREQPRSRRYTIRTHTSRRTNLGHSGKSVTASVAQVLIVGTPMMFHAKAFDTFAPFGPVVATDIDPSNLDTVCRVNREVRIKARTDDLIYSPDFLVSWISHIMGRPNSRVTRCHFNHSNANRVF